MLKKLQKRGSKLEAFLDPFPRPQANVTPAVRLASEQIFVSFLNRPDRSLGSPSNRRPLSVNFSHFQNLSKRGSKFLLPLPFARAPTVPPPPLGPNVQAVSFKRAHFCKQTSFVILQSTSNNHHVWTRQRRQGTGKGWRQASQEGVA